MYVPIMYRQQSRLAWGKVSGFCDLHHHTRAWHSHSLPARWRWGSHARDKTRLSNVYRPRTYQQVTPPPTYRDSTPSSAPPSTASCGAGTGTSHRFRLRRLQSTARALTEGGGDCEQWASSLAPSMFPAPAIVIASATPQDPSVSATSAVIHFPMD
jgi:hypothetical protein